MKLFKFIVLLTLLVTSCAYKSHEISLYPEIKITEIGNKNLINISVNDKRESKNLIGRQNSNWIADTDIKFSSDLEKLIKNKVAKALEDRNFVISDKDNKEANKILEINILSLKYENKPRIISMNSKVEASLSISIKNNDQEVLHKATYKSDLENNYYIFSPRAKTNEKNINIVLQEVINKIFSDQTLFEYLK